VEVPIARFRGVTPEAVVPCGSVADVVAVVGDVRRRGVAFAVRSGGHCFAGRSSTTGVVIDVGPMDEIVAGDGVVTVGAGARLGQIYDALEPLGRTIAGGCGPTVGIAGLTLGGGLGILGRRYGLTCDQLVGAEVVLADGSVVECDAQREPDLFWALRGAGGGQFGVVTRLTLATVEAPPAITCFDLTWPHEAAAEIIAAWQEWSPDAPDEMAASLIADGRTVHVFGAGDGRPPMRGETETVATLPYRDAKRWLADNGPAEEAEGRFDYSKSEFFRQPLPTSAVQNLTQHLKDGPGERRELDFSPWAGAYNRVAKHATAFPHRHERFLLKQTISTRGPAGDREKQWLRESWSLAGAYGAGGVYPNFPDPDLDDPLAAYHGTNLDRLRRVKAAYDPDGLFRFPQSL
jgi:FAD/FMN-containing dehydrogenase